MFLSLLSNNVVSQPVCTRLIRMNLLLHVLNLCIFDLAIQLQVVLLLAELLDDLFDHLDLKFCNFEIIKCAKTPAPLN